MDKAWKPQLRLAISKKVRELRKGRGLSQAILAKLLGLSQARLSIIESGGGSFSAEQLLEILRIFNVSPQAFWPGRRDVQGDIQNALARHGALHLVEDPDLLPSEQLDEIEDLVREVLLDGRNPRQVTALAPVLVRNVASLNLRRLWARFVDYGLENRLGWLLENNLAAIATITPTLPKQEQRRFQKAAVAFGNFLIKKLPSTAPGDSDTEPDILEGNALSEKTIANLWKDGSPVSHRWRIVTDLQVEDFTQALSGSLVVGRPLPKPIGHSATGIAGKSGKGSDDAD